MSNSAFHGQLSCPAASSGSKPNRSSQTEADFSIITSKPAVLHFHWMVERSWSDLPLCSKRYADLNLVRIKRLSVRRKVKRKSLSKVLVESALSTVWRRTKDYDVLIYSLERETTRLTYIYVLETYHDYQKLGEYIYRNSSATVLFEWCNNIHRVIGCEVSLHWTSLGAVDLFHPRNRIFQAMQHQCSIIVRLN